MSLLNAPLHNSNPYDPAQPMADPAHFYGQEAAFAFIRQQAFAERRPRAPLLIGRRGIGKTSILWQVSSRLDARTVAAYIDLAAIDLGSVTDGDDRAVNLWIALIDTARRSLDAVGVSIYRLPELPADLPAAEVRGWFMSDYLTVALAAMRQRRLLFLFDNTGALLDQIGDRWTTPTLLDQLGELLMLDERIKCLFALDLADAERAERHPLLSDPLLVYRVPYLSDFEADALIREPAVFAYGLHSEAAHAIRTLCGGFPYGLHAVNQLIFDRSAARGHADSITMDDVLAVLPDAIRATDPIYAPEWATSAPIERQVLASLSALAESNAGRPITRDALYAHLIRASDTVLDETSLIVSLRRLEYQDVIRAYPDRGYVFTVALQQQWLLIYGYLPPPAASISNTTPVAGPPNAPIGSTAAPRRAGVPIVGLIGALALIAALVLIVLASRSMAAGGSGAIGGTGTVSGAAEASTVTLDVNLQGTRLALSTALQVIAQTGTAQIAATDVVATHMVLALTPSLTATPTSTATATTSVTSSATLTPTHTVTSSATITLAATRTPAMTVTPSLTASRSATLTASATPINSAMPVASATISRTPTVTVTVTRSITPSMTASASSTPSRTPSDTPTATFTPSDTPSTTPSASDTPTITLTPTPPPPVTNQAFPTHLLPTSRP